MGMAVKLSEIKPDLIYLSTCLANAKPECPYTNPEDMAKALEGKAGVKVVIGTHDYH
jgi:predicted metal-binding protein